MRKRFVYFALVPLVLLCLAAYFFLDGIVEAALEGAGERLVGARVEIDGLRLTLSPLGLHFARLQVANPNDPWKNVFETGTVRFALDANQLLRAKYIVERMEVNDLILGTARTSDGSLPGGSPEAAPGERGPPAFEHLARQLLERTVEKTPLFDLAQIRSGANLDSVVRSFDFATVRHIDTLRARTATATQQWHSLQADIDTSSKRIDEITASIRTINPGQLKTADQILGAIAVVDKASKELDGLSAMFGARKTAIEGEIGQIRSAVDSIDDYAARDFQKVKTLARLPDLKTSGIAEVLLGRRVLEDVARSMYWIDLARATIRTYAPEPAMERPKRLRGQTIHFPVARNYPKLWVKKALLSGGTDRKNDPEFISVHGEITDITNDQSATGLPMRLALEGTRGTDLSFKLKALFDRTGELPLDSYALSLNGVRLSDVRLGTSDFLPSTISAALLHATAEIAVPGTRFDGSLVAHFRNMAMTFSAQPRTVAERIARAVLQKISGFTLTLRLWNTRDAFDMAFSTDLDEQFAGGLKNALGAEFARLENDLRVKVEARIAGKRKEFEALYEGKRREAEKLLGTYQTLVTDNLSVLDSKKRELTAQLEKQKKGAVDDLMKQIFKK